MSNYKLTVKFLAIIKESFVTHDIKKSVLYIIIIIIIIITIFIQRAYFTKRDIH